MIFKNIAYKVIDGKGKHHSSEEYTKSAMELVNVTSRSVSNVIEIKRLKCGRKLTAHPQFSNETAKAIVFHSPDYKKKLKYPKNAKYVCFLVLKT